MNKTEREEKWLELKSKLKSAVFIEIVIWIVVISSISGITYAVFYNKFIKPNLYVIEFHDVNGLIAGSPVKFMGVVIGHVRNFKYHNDCIDVQIIVTKKNIKIPPGSIASVEFSGIAGSKSIEILPPSSNLNDVGIIAKDTLRITDVLDAYEYIGKAFTSLKDFVDGVSQDTVLKVFTAVSQTSQGVQNISKTIDERQLKSTEFNKKMENIIEGQKKLEKTLDGVNETTKKIGSYLKN